MLRAPLVLALGSAIAMLVGCGGTDVVSTASTTTAGTTAATTGGAGGGSGGGAAAGGAAQGGAGQGGGAVAGPTTPDAKFLPKPTGTCPTLEKGKVTFAPAGVKARPVEIWIDPDAAAKADGPLVFFWHGVGGSPTEASYALGSAAMKAILAAGGVVAAPYHDAAAGQFPWWAGMGGSRMDDMLVADEIVGCALASVGLDVRHLHSVGFSAGAMQTEQLAAWRSGYIASIVAYSGARLGSPTDQEPGNKYAAMLFSGGPSDQVIINFDDATRTYKEKLAGEGRFSFICDHGKGHTVPSDGPPAAWTFLQDHPFGVAPEPYAGALPKGFPGYCAL